MPTAPTPSPLPPARKPSFTVSFVIDPFVGEKAPALRVIVRNPNATPLPLTTFSSPACFATHYLSIELTRPGSKPPVLAPCAVKDFPGTDGELAPNAERTIELPLSKVFQKLTAGRYEISISWDPSELDRARPGTGVGASFSTTNITQFVIAEILSTFRIERGKAASLPGGHRLTFRAHGHKHTMAGGPPSPLIIHGELTRKGKSAEEFSINVHTDERRVFSIDDLVFELVEHEYDGWMKLRYFGPITLDD